MACIQSACPQFTAECNASCACVAAFDGFGMCLAQGNSVLTCDESYLTGLMNDGVDASTTCSIACFSACGGSLPGDASSGG
jgi:hypothetical protein